MNPYYDKLSVDNPEAAFTGIAIAIVEGERDDRAVRLQMRALIAAYRAFENTGLVLVDLPEQVPYREEETAKGGV